MILGSNNDITILKKDKNQVIEKYRITDHRCSGKSVDDSFFTFLYKIFGSAMRSLQEEAPSAMLELKREFSRIKTNVTGFSSHKINMTIPSSTLDYYCKRDFGEDIHDLVANSGFGLKILNCHRLRIDSNIIQSFFKQSTEEIMNLMEKVFTDYKDAPKVTDIVLAGGFSGSPFVQYAVKQKFPNKNIQEITGIGVMKGAVLCGHQLCQNMHISESEVRNCNVCCNVCSSNSPAVPSPIRIRVRLLLQ